MRTYLVGEHDDLLFQLAITISGVLQSMNKDFQYVILGLIVQELLAVGD